jgi:hypothetical protein
MEKKKLLLVSVSVGLFLVIVIGASILVFSPRDYSLAMKAETVPVPPGTPRTSVGDSPTDALTEAPRRLTKGSTGLKMLFT